MWILKDIEKHKKSKLYPKLIIWIIVLSIIWYFSYDYFIPQKENTTEKEKQIFTVTTWNLKTSISWDWKILYKQDYNLNFPISGIITEIKKQEWQEIKQWEIIATLDTKYLELNVDKAEIALKKVRAELSAKQNQYSNSDIKLSQEQLESTKTNLENIKLTWEIDIKNALTNLETAKLNLETALNNTENTKTTSWNDIENFEIALETAKIDLENGKSNLIIIENEEKEKYENKQENAISVIWLNNSFIKEKLLDIDKLLWITKENKDLNNKFEDFLWAKNSTAKNDAKTSFIQTNKKFEESLIEWKNYTQWEIDFSKLEKFLQKATENSKQLNESLGHTLETVKSSISSVGALSENDIENYIKTYEDSIIETKKEITNIANTKQTIEEQKTTMNSKIESQKNTIETLESKLLLSESNLKKAKSNLEVWVDTSDDKVKLAKKQLEQAQINYKNSQKKAENNLKIAQNQIEISNASLWTKTVSQSELAPYYTNIENAQKSLEEAKIKLEDAVLKSPIEWTIVKINWNIGSFAGWDKDLAFAIVTNDNQFYVESYVEEIDISRVKNNSNVYLTFDALDWVKLPWKVDYISDKSTTDSNSIVTYRVEISFEPKQSWVREWMTTYVEYITNEVKNVKIIPVSAVKPVNGKPSVLLENNTWKPVATWFTDWEMVEIITWLEKGEKVIY